MTISDEVLAEIRRLQLQQSESIASVREDSADAVAAVTGEVHALEVRVAGMSNNDRDIQRLELAVKTLEDDVHKIQLALAERSGADNVRDGHKKFWGDLSGRVLGTLIVTFLLAAAAFGMTLYQKFGGG